MPTWLAIQWVLATTPNVPAISGRVVNMGLSSASAEGTAGSAAAVARDFALLTAERQPLRDDERLRGRALREKAEIHNTARARTERAPEECASARGRQKHFSSRRKRRVSVMWKNQVPNTYG